MKHKSDQTIVIINITVDPDTAPARFYMERAAKWLGFQPHDIPHLVKGGLLKPLGDGNGAEVKYFARDYILRLCSDQAWLSTATTYMQRVWKKKTAARKAKGNGKQGADSQPE